MNKTMLGLFVFLSIVLPSNSFAGDSSAEIVFDGHREKATCSVLYSDPEIVHCVSASYVCDYQRGNIICRERSQYER